MSKMSKVVAALGVVAGLGVAALPLSSYAATSLGSSTANVQVEAVVGDTIEITADTAKVTLGTGTGDSRVNVVKANDSNIAEGTTKVSVKTNANNGYSVTMKGANVGTALTATGPGATTGIPTGQPTVGTGGNANANAWGYKVSNLNAAATTASGMTRTTAIDAAAQNYAGIVGSGGTAATLVTADKATGGTADTFDLTFGVTVNLSVIPDTYTNEVVLTATTNS